MSKVTVTPWTDDLFDAREAEFAVLVLDGVRKMTEAALAVLRKREIVTAAAQWASQEPPAETGDQAQRAALAAWSIWVQTELSPAVGDVFDEGSALVVDQLAGIFGEDVRELIPPVGNAYADDYLQHARNRMTGVGDNVWKGIQRELAAGLEAGEGIPELAERLENYAGLSEGRARTVARTEVISSANAGSYLQMVEAGIEGTTKEWLATTDDHRTRVSHKHANDQAVPLAAQFQVEVYTQGELTGTEPMDFPGYPLATPGNVINCRCGLGFSFDDEDGPGGILTAAGKFVEAEHPRDANGKFMNKLEINLLKAKDKDAFLDELTTAEKAKIGKATKDKAGVTKNTPDKPKGGADKRTGKRAPEGKPVFLRVKRLFETDYADGDVVAVRPESRERVVWDADKKRMLLQRDGKTADTLTRGALMKLRKDEEGWFTPGGDIGDGSTSEITQDDTPTPELETPAPPAKPKARKLYAVYNGQVETRTTSRDYKYASVVHVGGRDIIYSWHTTREKAAKGTLTGMQKQNGAKVVSVIDVTDQPIVPSVVPAANVPETPQASVPVPADIPAVRADNGIPPAGDLTSTGKIVGSHGATVYRDNSTGKQWLFKPVPSGMGTFIADIDVATARLHDIAGLPTPTTGTITIGGRYGSIQEMFPGATDPFGYNFKPVDLTPEDKLVIQKEQIFDWLISNHDSHAANYIRLPDGSLVGVDKGQAFKFFGSDDLEPTFNPNEHTQTANLLLQAYANGEGGGALIFGVNHPEIKKFISRVEAIPDDEYRQILRPYAVNAAKYHSLARGGPSYLGLTPPVIPANDVDAFLDYAVERKNQLRDDFEFLYGDLAQQRKARLVQSTPALEPMPQPILRVDPVQSVTSDGASVVMDKATLEKTSYSHGQIVAVGRRGLDRVIWNDNNKMYEHQISSMSSPDDWFTAQSLSKTASVRYLSEEHADWIKPGGKTHADIPSPLPKVSEEKPSRGPRLVAVPFTMDDLSRQDPNPPRNLTGPMRQQVFDMFETEGIEPIGSARGYDMFFRVLSIQAEFRERGIDVSTLALIRLIDRVHEQRNGPSRQPRVESRVVQWLDNPDGELEAGQLWHRYQLSAGAQTPAETRTYSEVAAIPVSVPGKGGSFTAMSEADAEEFHDVAADDLTLPTVEAIRQYSASSYLSINPALRDHDSTRVRAEYPTEGDYLRAGRIQHAMRPLPRDVLLYRGAGESALGFGGSGNPATLEKVRSLIGKTFQDKGFISTSIQRDASYTHMQLQFTIQAPKGSPALAIGPVSANASEQEVILAAGTKFVIVSADPATGTGGSTINITVRIVP